ncbi:Type II secretion system protein F [Pirellulimonas nuda]|uniref:Type II secretion system protein F n=1 Tax=Pirellulimonas nuda TaxID=2528009 RepID=A0A518DFY3_9BACT|nr:type II secretion system F family protein [Pirellulimonas nuda]QDU90381.1 Type II secretion system protein F [Pirellulimonas nuda]
MNASAAPPLEESLDPSADAAALSLSAATRGPTQGPPPRRLPGLQGSAPGASSAAARGPRAKGAGSKPLDKRDLVMMVTQLSIMTRSGVDVADAINSIAGRASKPAVRESLSQLHAALQEGSRLSQALAAQGDRFGGVMTASVAAGEASGKLPQVLDRMRVLMRDELRLRSAIRSVVSYPLVLMVVTFGVLGAMVFFVLPQFGSIYESSQAPTPVVTKLLLNTASVIRTYWWAVAAAGGLGLVGAARLARSATGRRWIDRTCFQIPLLRSVCRSLGVGRVFRLQGVLLESGVPLLEVLQLTKSVSRNSLMKDLNARMQQAVLVGKRMSSALEGHVCVPDGALEMVATAEANGQLAGVLQTVGEFFESEGEQQLKEVVKIAEPIIIVLLGVVVGAIVLAVMMPMLDLSTAGAH